jgi:hypothetical protein
MLQGSVKVSRQDASKNGKSNAIIEQNASTDEVSQAVTDENSVVPETSSGVDGLNRSSTAQSSHELNLSINSKSFKVTASKTFELADISKLFRDPLT